MNSAERLLLAAGVKIYISGQTVEPLGVHETLEEWVL